MAEKFAEKVWKDVSSRRNQIEEPEKDVDGISGNSSQGPESIKHEGSVEYLLILPQPNECEFPKKVKQEQSNVKSEPAVEYLLILPLDGDNQTRGFPMPKRIKRETSQLEMFREVDANVALKYCSVKLSKLTRRQITESNFSVQFCPRFCRLCPTATKFYSREDLIAHQRQKHKHFFCKLCKLTFKHLSSFTVHRCKKDPKAPLSKFKCTFCSKEFAEQGNLSQHVPIHLNDMKAPCEVCGKVLVKNRLRQHMTFVHNSKPIFKCDLCSLKMKTKFQIRAHMAVHMKPFECDVCKRKFAEERYFKEHKLCHENPDAFKCKKCGKAYTRKTSLARHRQTAHSKARNFPCSQCKYRGKTQDDLTTHIKSHTQAYQCDLCSRKFSRSSLLKQHRVLHDNPNAYQCKICLHPYKQKKDLKKHLAQKHVK